MANPLTITLVPPTRKVFYETNHAGIRREFASIDVLLADLKEEILASTYGVFYNRTIHMEDETPGVQAYSRHGRYGAVPERKSIMDLTLIVDCSQVANRVNTARLIRQFTDLGLKDAVDLITEGKLLFFFGIPKRYFEFVLQGTHEDVPLYYASGLDAQKGVEYQALHDTTGKRYDFTVEN